MRGWRGSAVLASKWPSDRLGTLEILASVCDGGCAVVCVRFAGGEGDGSATYMPTEHAGWRSGVGRARTTRRLAEASQQQLGEGEACFSVLTQGPPKLGAASFAGAAGLLPEPPASGSAGRS